MLSYYYIKERYLHRKFLQHPMVHKLENKLVESDIPWIGKIPKHWGLSKIGRHFKLERGRVISNLENICLEAGASLNDIVKLNIYLIDLENFASLNKVMEEKFSKPFPARATVEVARLPKNVTIEVDAIVNLKK